MVIAYEREGKGVAGYMQPIPSIVSGVLGYFDYEVLSPSIFSKPFIQILITLVVNIFLNFQKLYRDLQAKPTVNQSLGNLAGF